MYGCDNPADPGIERALIDIAWNQVEAMRHDEWSEDDAYNFEGGISDEDDVEAKMRDTLRCLMIGSHYRP